MTWAVTDKQERHVEFPLERRELTMLISEGNVLKVSVQAPDEFSGLHCVQLLSAVFDSYHGRWLEPRRAEHFLTTEQLKQLGEFLAGKC